MILLFLLAFSFSAPAQVCVQDIFGRPLNQHGITLVDWDGYMANPLIRLYLLPPTNAALPGSVTLTANRARFYFDGASSVSPSGPATTLFFPDTNPIPVGFSIFPAHQDPDDPGALTLVFTGANDVSQTNTVPIQVIDEDTHHTNDFVVTANFDRDVTGFFTNPLARKLVTQAANDWTYYFTGMDLDPVLIGTEQTFIWSNNFDGGYYFLNTNSYTGYQLYAYGTTNDTIRSGGEGSFAGNPQTSDGIPLTIQRSGGFEANIMGNFNTLGWLFLTNDDDWLASQNLGNQTNDFFSIAHHEIGHALIFNPAHAGFATALANGAFTSAAVTNYYGGPVGIDPNTDHLLDLSVTNVIDPESGQGGFGNEFFGNIPRCRWTMTKLDLLCAQEVGYTLRPTSAFIAFDFPSNALPGAQLLVPYTAAFTAAGGIPIYDWDISSGALPPGLVLDPFTGALSGTPATNGTFNFTVHVRDYHQGSSGLTRDFSLVIAVAPQLAITIIDQGTDSRASILLSGSPGQTQIIQSSSNLSVWVPLVTNTLASNTFQYTDPSPLQPSARFYRSVYTP